VRESAQKKRPPHKDVMQGVELTSKKRGYPPIAQMKAKWRGQNR